MLVTLKVSQMVHPFMTDHERTSYFIKKVLFITSMFSTVGLLIFFAKHRLLCHDMGMYYNLNISVKTSRNKSVINLFKS